MAVSYPAKAKPMRATAIQKWRLMFAAPPLTCRRSGKPGGRRRGQYQPASLGGMGCTPMSAVSSEPIEAVAAPTKALSMAHSQKHRRERPADKQRHDDEGPVPIANAALPGMLDAMGFRPCCFSSGRRAHEPCFCRKRVQTLELARAARHKSFAP